MRYKEEYRKKLEENLKHFEEKYGDISKIAIKETSSLKKHKLLKKEEFFLGEEVYKELLELEITDLNDLERSNGRT